MPPIAQQTMYFRVARPTQCLQVACVMRSARRQRFLVMDVLGRGVASFGKTHLAQRVLRGKPCSDHLPCFSVSCFGCWISLILLVVLRLKLCVFFAEPSINKLRTTRIRTRPFRFLWHCVSPNKKAPRHKPQSFINLFRYCNNNECF